MGHQLEKWKSMLKKKEGEKNQGGSTKWQSRADNGCCHLAVTLSNLKEQRSLETRRGATAAAAVAPAAAPFIQTINFTFSYSCCS